MSGGGERERERERERIKDHKKNLICYSNSYILVADPRFARDNYFIVVLLLFFLQFKLI